MQETQDSGLSSGLERSPGVGNGDPQKPSRLQSMRPESQARLSTHAHTHTRTHTCAHTHTHTHRRTHARTHTRTHTRARARMHAHTHACTRMRTHARTHARTHTHTHAQTVGSLCSLASFTLSQHLRLLHVFPWCDSSLLPSAE